MLIFPRVRMVILKDRMFPTVMCSKRFVVYSWSLSSNALWASFIPSFSFLPFKAFRIDNMYLLTVLFWVSMH